MTVILWTKKISIDNEITKVPSLLKNYYTLTKPGIIKGNLITVLAGYVYGSQASADLVTFLGLLIGSVLTLACGTTLNNVLDKNIDRRMKRTSSRVVASDKISVKNATIFGIVIGLIGVSILYLSTNPLTAGLGLFAVFYYVIIYGLAKRFTYLATEIGTIPGAIPIVAGYTASTNIIDFSAFMLFIIMVIWQIPHFYAISLYRKNDYELAGIPTISTIKRAVFIKYSIVVYVSVFIGVNALFWLYGSPSILYLFAMSTLGLYWFWAVVSNIQTSTTRNWAKQVFGVSLKVLVGFCLILCLDVLIA